MNLKLDELDRRIRAIIRLEQLNQEVAQAQDGKQKEQRTLSTPRRCRAHAHRSLVTQQRNELRLY